MSLCSKGLKFKSYLVELDCNDNWVEEAIINAKNLINKDQCLEVLTNVIHVNI